MNCLVIRDIFLHRSLFSEDTARGRSFLQHLQLVCVSLPSFLYLITLLHEEHLDDLYMEENPISCLEKLLGCFVQFALCSLLCSLSTCTVKLCVNVSRVHPTASISSNQQWPGSRQPYMPVSSRCLRHRVTSGLQLAVNFMKLFPACRLWQWHAHVFQSALGYILWCLCAKAIKY